MSQSRTPNRVNMNSPVIYPPSKNKNNYLCENQDEFDILITQLKSEIFD